MNPIAGLTLTTGEWLFVAVLSFIFGAVCVCLLIGGE